MAENDEQKNSDLSEHMEPVSPEDKILSDDFEQDRIKQALLTRPRFTVKLRLIIIFLTFFLLSALTSFTAMYMQSRIDNRVRYVLLTEKFSNEIHEARRAEKNYFLYNSDLSLIQTHIQRAAALLMQAERELGHIVSKNQLDEIHDGVRRYRQLVAELIEHQYDQGYQQSPRFQEVAVALRTNGSKILEMALNISSKERRLISRTIQLAHQLQIFLIILLLPLSIFLATYITRHIIKRLNRLMEATQKFAEGDFSPITPRRKYKDEFTHLTIALNNMMYEIDKRQRLLVESHKLRAIGNLTAGVAHELNNPINNIILTAEMLKESYKDITEDEYLDMIHDLVTQGERAQQVVKNLLDFARESKARQEPIYMDQLLDETIQLAKNQIKLSKIKLETSFETNLQPVSADRNLLTQVFLNLFINAIDSMPGGGTLTISVQEEKYTGFITVKIKDTGCGIPSHLLKSIFNPFFTTKPTGKGTGLGLSVSKGIIEKHGGAINVESEPGKGTTFTVHLPIVYIPADLRRKEK